MFFEKQLLINIYKFCRGKVMQKIKALFSGLKWYHYGIAAGLFILPGGIVISGIFVAYVKKKRA